MAVIAEVQAVQDEVRAVKESPTKEAEMSEQWERIAKLEGRFEESDKHLATKADVERVRFDVLVEVAEVRTEVEKVRTEVERVRSDVLVEVEKVRTEVAEVRTEVERVRSDVLERVAGVEGRVDSVDKKVDSVDKKVDSVDKKVGLLMWFMGIGVVVGLGFGGWIATLLSRLLAGGIP